MDGSENLTKLILVEKGRHKEKHPKKNDALLTWQAEEHTLQQLLQSCVKIEQHYKLFRSAAITSRRLGFPELNISLIGL